MVDDITTDTPEQPTTAPVDAAAPQSTSTPTTKEIKRQVELCRTERKDLISEWTDSREYHKGTPFSEDSETDRVYVNKDWPRVKARVSSLFGQMPEVRLLPKNIAFAPAVPVFAKELNDTLKRADVDEAVFQALTDNTATAGIGVVMVDCQRRTDSVEVPMIDMSTIPPEQATMLLAAKQIPMEMQDVTTDILFTALRRSPTDLLWPIEFTGFNFDKADWLGLSGELGWAEAKTLFKLRDEDKEKILGEGKEPAQTLKEGDDASSVPAGQPKVEFDELFYWAYRFDPDEKYFKKIKRVVFVKGLADPVIHEDWSGQQFNEEAGTYVGACRFPIRVLKINYVSDDAIPPSESAIGRPQVVELNESRSYQHEHRKRSLPQGWVNVNKMDPDTLVNLMMGKAPRWMPVNGRGEDAMGELGRTQYPAEFQMFDRTVNQDLDEIYQQGANQQGAFASGERSASEARIVQQNFDMRNGLDRAHVAKFVQSIAEVMAGYLAIFGEFELSTPEEVERLNSTWDRTQIAGEFVYEVIPDSMIRLDAHQQISLYMDVLNMVGKSGFVNPAPIIGKILSLAGEDPALIMTQPNPPPTEPLNISIRSAEDLHDPLMLALLMKTDQAPTPEQLEAAKALAAASMLPMGIVQPDGGQPPTDGSMPTAPPKTATAPEGMAVMEKVSKRSDYK
jgi:hypothetical protein